MKLLWEWGNTGGGSMHGEVLTQITYISIPENRAIVKECTMESGLFNFPGRLTKTTRESNVSSVLVLCLPFLGEV